MTILETKELKKYYDSGEYITKALDGVSLEIEEGEFVAIVGASGSGKSTLLNMIGGLDIPTSGSVLVKGKKIGQLNEEELTVFRRRNIGFVFQNFGLIENMTVGQNVELPLLYAGISNQEKTRLVAESLEKVGLADFVGQSVKLLSGGQRQRVAIARAIVNSPKFIIADEPTGALDSKTSVDIMQLFTDLNTTSGVTIILVTHDPNLMAHCNREIRVSDGEVVL